VIFSFHNILFACLDAVKPVQEVPKPRISNIPITQNVSASVLPAFMPFENLMPKPREISFHKAISPAQIINLSAPTLPNLHEASNLVTRSAVGLQERYIGRDEMISKGSAPLGYGDNTMYFKTQVCQFLHLCCSRKSVSPFNIFPVGGVSDGLDKLCTMFMKRNRFVHGAFVYVEDTTYMLAVNIFRDRGLKIRTVATDEDGIVVQDLKQKLDSLRLELHASQTEGREMAWPLFVYVIPTFSNPTGRTLSLSRRLELLQLTAAYNIPVVSDDAYDALDFTNEILELNSKEKTNYPIPAIRSLMDFGFHHVYSVSSFSKIIAPGLRVGWIETGIKENTDELKKLATEASGGCICHYSASVVAFSLFSAADKGGNVNSIAVELSKLRKKLASQFAILASDLMKYSKMVLPEGTPNNTLRICNYDNIELLFQRDKISPRLPSSRIQTDIGQNSMIGQYGVVNFGASSSNNAHFVNTSTYDATQNIPGTNISKVRASHSGTKNLGGYYMWVRLPDWINDVSSLRNSKGTDMSNNDHHAKMIHAGNDLGTTAYSGSGYVPLRWLVEKARQKYFLDFKLDIDFMPDDDVSLWNQRNDTHDYNTFQQQQVHPLAYNRSFASGRHVRLCFANACEEVLHTGAQRFCNLLADVYADYVKSRI
jgi:histidinol-phosphate/aromatic aminotransferase/cobyric acid decarboxylase-like protein